MGRLFWKFFLILLLAQALAIGGTGVAYWLHDPRHEPPPPPPPPSAAAPFPPGPMPPGERPGGPGLPVFPLVAAGIVSLLFAALLALYFSRPIRSLRAAFQSLANGRLETRVGVSFGRRHDELADLGRDFDLMAQRLQALVDGQRRLLHDVSHEMRAPLARLQAAIGLWRQNSVDGERTESCLRRIERESERMDNLVGELLTLSRLEAGLAGAMDEEVDMDELLATVVDDARFEAAEAGGHVVLQGDAGHLRGQTELLHRALENVVRNALRHSPPGGTIHIHARRSPQQLSIDISDQGPGIPPSRIESMFEPFVRGPNASTEGHGLGLAITRRVMETHGGSVTAENHPDGGLRVTLRVPLQGTD